MIDRTTATIVVAASFALGYFLMLTEGPNFVNFWYTLMGLFGLFAIYHVSRIKPLGFPGDSRFYVAPAIYILVLVTILNMEHKMILGHGLSLAIQIVSALILLGRVIFLEMTGYFKNNL